MDGWMSCLLAFFDDLDERRKVSQLQYSALVEPGSAMRLSLALSYSPFCRLHRAMQTDPVPIQLPFCFLACLRCTGAQLRFACVCASSGDKVSSSSVRPQRSRLTLVRVVSRSLFRLLGPTTRQSVSQSVSQSVLALRDPFGKVYKSSTCRDAWPMQ